MKKEARILLIKEFTCRNTYSIYIIIRGVKGIEHIALLEGTKDDVLSHLRETGFLEEVRKIVDLNSAIDVLSMPGLDENMDFIKRLLDKTYSLICSNE